MLELMCLAALTQQGSGGGKLPIQYFFLKRQSVILQILSLWAEGGVDQHKNYHLSMRYVDKM
jgi:hypothetical protein